MSSRVDSRTVGCRGLSSPGGNDARRSQTDAHQGERPSYRTSGAVLLSDLIEQLVYAVGRALACTIQLAEIVVGDCALRGTIS